MNRESFEELLTSVREGAAILRGDKNPSRSFEIGRQDIKAVRERLNLSQREFAALLGISTDNLQNWEQGRRKPRGAAKILIRVAEKHPEAILDVIQEELGPQTAGSGANPPRWPPE